MNGMSAIKVPGKNLLVANTSAPMAEPSHNVSFADMAEAFFQNTPSKNTQVIGGAIWAMISLRPLKMHFRWEV